MDLPIPNIHAIDLGHPFPDFDIVYALGDLILRVVYIYYLDFPPLPKTIISLLFFMDWHITHIPDW